MFSYFKDGIKDTTPTKKISIEKLVKEIKTNDNPIIREIRSLDPEDIDYETRKKKFKQRLPNITPNCTVSYRDDEHITEFTGYMYFDIDNCGEPQVLKTQLIEEYSEHIGMICISCSGRGLSILTKIENEVTKSNFKSIREYICNNIFEDLNLDAKTKSKSNAWFISYDPDCYFNPCSVIIIPEEFITEEEDIKEGDIHTIYNPSTDLVQKSPYQYKLIPISEVIDKLKFKTVVIVNNKVFDMRTVEYCEVFITNKSQIPKGRKQTVFTQVIHNLVYLNPNIEPDYIFSYINWLNYNMTVPGTEATSRDLISFFNMVYIGIKNTGVLNPKTRIKYFHCKDNTISPAERRLLSRKMTALYRKYESINKILLAKEILETENTKGAIHTIYNPPHDLVRNAPFIKRATQKEVYKLINDLAKKNDKKSIGIRTVKEYWNSEHIDIDEVVRLENEKIEITYIPKETKRNDEDIDNGVLDTQILDETGN